MEKYFTVDQVAKLIDMHPKTVRKFIKEGKLRANKVGKQWRITGHDLSVFTEGSDEKVSESTNPDVVLSINGEESSERVKISAVVDINLKHRDEWDRISTFLMAVLNNKDPKYGKSTINLNFLEKEMKARVLLWGNIEFIQNMLDTISMLTN